MKTSINNIGLSKQSLCFVATGGRSAVSEILQALSIVVFMSLISDSCSFIGKNKLSDFVEFWRFYRMMNM